MNSDQSQTAESQYTVLAPGTPETPPSVGHSLGSVVSYDVLNQLLCEDAS